MNSICTLIIINLTRKLVNLTFKLAIDLPIPWISNFSKMDSFHTENFTSRSFRCLILCEGRAISPWKTPSGRTVQPNKFGFFFLFFSFLSVSRSFIRTPLPLPPPTIIIHRLTDWSPIFQRSDVARSTFYPESLAIWIWNSTSSTWVLVNRSSPVIVTRYVEHVKIRFC